MFNIMQQQQIPQALQQNTMNQQLPSSSNNSDYVWGVPGAQQHCQQIFSAILQTQILMQQQIMQQLQGMNPSLLGQQGHQAIPQMGGVFGLGCWGLNPGLSLSNLNQLQSFQAQSFAAQQKLQHTSLATKIQMKAQPSGDNASGSLSGSYNDTQTEMASAQLAQDNEVKVEDDYLSLINDEAFSSEGAMNSAILDEPSLDDSIQRDKLPALDLENLVNMHKVASFADLDLADFDGFLEDGAIVDQGILEDGVDIAVVLSDTKDGGSINPKRKADVDVEERPAKLSRV